MLLQRFGFILSAICLFILAGCQQQSGRGDYGLSKQTRGKNVLFAVEFTQGQTIRYRLVSDRKSIIDFEQNAAKGKDSTMKVDERMELVVAYEAIDVDENGFAKIRARCESAGVTRDTAGKTSRRDAVESLAGKSFTFTITPSGLIKDTTGMNSLIQQLVQKAFASDGGGNIKDPEMILDFIALQWFMWDSASSIPDPARGVSPGEKWDSKLLIPVPFPLRLARDVTYRLHEVRDVNDTILATIRSSYSVSDSVPDDWPRPYQGSFKMRGTFGFFYSMMGGFNIQSVTGTGRQIFNVDTGILVEDNQDYVIEAIANRSLPLGGGSGTPKLTITQKLSAQLLQNGN
ncbi:MAG: hypothetical protein ABIG61_11690 [Planctomycetota bacterium]